MDPARPTRPDWTDAWLVLLQVHDKGQRDCARARQGKCPAESMRKSACPVHSAPALWVLALDSALRASSDTRVRVPIGYVPTRGQY
eukprot:857227-Rhodomonas_salina.1